MFSGGPRQVLSVQDHDSSQPDSRPPAPSDFHRQAHALRTRFGLSSRGRGHFKLTIRVALPVRSVQIAPNHSLKRTVQSLRDWSCRLVQALGAGVSGGPRRGSCRQVRDSSQPDFPLARAGRQHAASPPGCRVAGDRSTRARASTKSVEFRVASSPRSGQIAPNSSLKRTNQSLRD